MTPLMQNFWQGHALFSGFGSSAELTAKLPAESRTTAQAVLSAPQELVLNPIGEAKLEQVCPFQQEKAGGSLDTFVN